MNGTNGKKKVKGDSPKIPRFFSVI